jgi:outer membrane lipoprotein-sorting protein
MGAWLLSITLITVSAAMAQPAHSLQTASPDSPLSVEEVIKNVQQKNRERAQALRQFQSTRIYRLKYRGFPSELDAEMTVNVNYQSPGKKEFRIVSQTGSKFIINHVFRRLIEGEQEAADKENEHQTALSPENYKFQMDSYAVSPSGGEYVLDVTPKSDNKFLYRGKIWVDAKDFAVTHIKAEPAKNPSIWIKKTEIEHRYVKVDGFWLPFENHSESIIRLGGRATLTIEYKDYRVLGACCSVIKRDGVHTSGLQDVPVQQLCSNCAAPTFTSNQPH